MGDEQGLGSLVCAWDRMHVEALARRAGMIQVRAAAVRAELRRSPVFNLEARGDGRMGGRS